MASLWELPTNANSGIAQMIEGLAWEPLLWAGCLFFSTSDGST